MSVYQRLLCIQYVYTHTHRLIYSWRDIPMIYPWRPCELVLNVAGIYMNCLPSSMIFPMAMEHPPTKWRFFMAGKIIHGTFSIADWWFSHPSEKYQFVNWDDEIPNIWKHKIHIPNHQPDIIPSNPIKSH